ncbi:MAG: hypothetical protein QW366_04255 [Sulfolobales archaeon]
MKIEKAFFFIEALTGGFYVSITRTMFIPMLAYYGYPLDQISYIVMASGVLGIALSMLMYRYPEIISKSPKLLLVLTHFLERVLWFSLPFLLDQPLILSIVYGMAQSITIPVGVLLNYSMLVLFPEEKDFTDLTILRTAGGSASSVLGLIIGVYATAFIEPPSVYEFLYFISFMIGILGTLSISPLRVDSIVSLSRTSASEISREEIEISKINTFTMLSLMNIGANILGIAWTPLLKNLGAPLSIPVALGLVGSIGGVIGPYLWKGFRMYLVAMMINALTVLLIPLTTPVYIHLLYSFILSATFVGANLIGVSIYSRYVRSIGIVRASTFLTASTAVGMLISSFVGVLVRGDITLALIISSTARFLAVLVAVLAIPETALIPREIAVGYARLVYSTTLLGYTFAVETSIRTLKITLQIIGIVILIVLVFLIYRIGFILYKGV